MKETQRYGTIMSSGSITPEPAEQKADASAAPLGGWSPSDAGGNTRQAYLFPLFLLVNVAVMTDRAIVAGASNEFAAFVSSARDSPAFAVESPDAGIGLIQAAFILGYSVAVLLSGHYVHKVRWKPLVLSGLCVWWLGVLGSGNAKDYGSFYVLLFSRMATGCAEAAFTVVAPPLIQDRGGAGSGMWLSFYLTGLPVGLALGYVYGSHMATSDVWDWGWAFYFLNAASLPLLVAMAFVRDGTNGGVLSGAGEFEEVAGRTGDAPDDGTTERMTERTAEAGDDHHAPSDDDDGREPLEPLLGGQQQQQPAAADARVEHRSFTLWSETRVCLSSGVLVSLSLGWAAIMGVVASLGTFGGAYVLALQLFDDEKSAATAFGITAAASGVVGVPMGGKLADGVLARYIGQDGGGASTSSSGEGVDDSLRHPIAASLMGRVWVLVLLALLAIYPTLAIDGPAPFLALLFVGWTLLFATQTSITLVAMLSVDRSHRPNALAFLTLTSHILGDVPLPVLLGLIKDRMAPSCSVDESGHFSDPEGCAAEESGVRGSLAVAYSWVIWSLLFFWLARRAAKRKIAEGRREEFNPLFSNKEKGGDETEQGNPFRYYHAKFRPTGS
mmetsp:Transcript_12646/g.28881  ORF Transcript_12646/g.28881 Transcript_12646/m.28881 type:complete len:613 (+) Transcript_12646:321-2159(+)